MKKFVSFTITIGCALFLTNCGDPTIITNISTKIERIPVVLTDQDLFSGNKILAFLENETKFIQEANELFLKGLNAFRNENNLDSADHYLRQSILKEPSAKAYFELGNVQMDKEDYDMALKAFGVAEQLDYAPFSKILYNKSCLYALQKKNELAGKYLEYALQAGYNNLDHISKDEDLAEFRTTHRYKEAIEKGLRGMSDGENLFWLQFKKMFAVEEMPLKLNVSMKMDTEEDWKNISYDYEKYISEMRDEEFSREVSKEFYYYARPYENENFVAIIYIVSDVFMGEYAPLTYRMATFTHEGKLIDKKEISGRSLLSDPIMQATLNNNMTIDVELLEPVYENDPDDYGYYDNPMISSESVGNKQFKLTKRGKIQEIKVESDDITQK